jgi:ribonuclease D
MLTVERIALDTEFHREKTYYPKLALLQLAWDGGLALVDPLAVDVAPLAEVLESDIVVVMHAAQQDLEVLQRACDAIPRVLFDTQIAAGFVGFSSPSLVSLAESVLGVKLSKADRLTDWLRRPLDDDQKIYAAADVEHLFALHDRLRERLSAAGRLSWAETECESLRVNFSGPGDPNEAWLKIKEARQLRGKARGVAQAIAGWRERAAAMKDIPVRYLLGDLAVVSIAQRPPRSLDDLAKVRGVDERMARGQLGQGILAAVEDGLSITPLRVHVTPAETLDRELRPALTLVSAWVSQVARDAHLDPALLATRQDLSDLLRDDPQAALSHGWRAEMVGDAIRHLVLGKAAIAFDGHGNLVLEPRFRADSDGAI